jgi:mannosyltransferase OCH1-like enzyme
MIDGMKKALISAAGQSMRQVMALSGPTLQAFANHHGYELICHLQIEDGNDTKDPASIQARLFKITALREALNHYDIALWVDADAMIVRFDRDILNDLSSDCFQGLVLEQFPRRFNPNTGVWIMRRSEAAFDFLADVEARSKNLRDSYWWGDQAAVCAALGWELDDNHPVDGGFELRARPVHFSRHLQGTAWLPPEWNPLGIAAGVLPRISHFAGMTNEDRLNRMRPVYQRLEHAGLISSDRPDQLGIRADRAFHEPCVAELIDLKSDPPATAASPGGGLMKIPRLLHQTWRTHELPTAIGDCVASVRSANPSWEYRFTTDDDFESLIQRQKILSWRQFQRLPTGIQKADALRLACLFVDGGVYADVDMECFKSLDTLIEDATRLGYINESTEVVLTVDHPVHQDLIYSGRTMYMNNFLIAAPGAKLIEKALSSISLICQCSRVIPLDAIHTTGPGLLTAIIERYGGPEKLNVAVLPAPWIHPLPDMQHPFAERGHYEELIRSRSWKSKFDPYLCHHWWHSNLNDPCNFSLYPEDLPLGSRVQLRAMPPLPFRGSQVEVPS